MAEVFIVTGGTGGHIFPAIEVKKVLEKMNIKTILCISSKDFLKIEHDFKFDSAPFKGENKIKIIKNILKILKGIVQSFIYTLKYKPKSIFIFGSYASFPFLIPSVFLNKKIFVFEQNSIPGLTTRIFSKFAYKIFISFEQTRNYLKKRCIFIGNPIREFKLKSKEEAGRELNLDVKNKNIILFIGGSQGAKKLIEIAFKYSEITQNLVLVLAGKHFNEFSNKMKTGNLIIFPFRQDMENFYSIADIVVSRCGAGTIFELLKLRKKGILIPYPYAADNHQYYNALFAAKMGTFVIIKESKLNIHNLDKAINSLLFRKAEFKELPDWKKIIKKEVRSVICIKRN